MEYGLSMWAMVYRYGWLPYGYGHSRYQYGIWANDMGDDIIDMVILDIDMGCHVTLATKHDYGDLPAHYTVLYLRDCRAVLAPPDPSGIMIATSQDTIQLKRRRSTMCMRWMTWQA
jgi:hypothetical protein